MNTPVKVLIAVLAVMALVLAGLAARLALQPAPAATAPSAPTFPVVVSARPIAAGQRLAAEDLRVERFPLRPAGAHGDTAALVGQRVAMDLGAGVPVLDTLTSSGLAHRVPTGQRAVAVRVDEAIGIGHRVRPGDVVDLFLLLKHDSREVAFTQSRLLLPALRVLAYGGESIDGPAQPADGAPRDGTAKREAARTAILSVPLAQVNRLLLGAGTGQLAMALRNPDDVDLPKPMMMALQTAMPLPPGEEAPADRAAAGVRLDTLAHSNAAPGMPQRAAPVAPLRAATVPYRVAAKAPTPPAAPDRIEVLRPGRRESVSY